MKMCSIFPGNIRNMRDCLCLPRWTNSPIVTDISQRSKRDTRPEKVMIFCTFFFAHLLRHSCLRCFSLNYAEIAEPFIWLKKLPQLSSELLLVFQKLCSSSVYILLNISSSLDERKEVLLFNNAHYLFLRCFLTPLHVEKPPPPVHSAAIMMLHAQIWV